MSTLIFAGVFLIAGFFFLSALFGLLRGSRRPDRDRPVRHTFLSHFEEDLQTDLSEAGINGITPARFMLYSLGLGGFIGLLLTLITGYLLLSVVISGFVGLYMFRSVYLGGLASKRRRLQLEHILIATREITQILEQDLQSPAIAALTTFVQQDLSLTGEPNQITEALTAAVMNPQRGLSIKDTMGIEADRLGNTYFRRLVDTYLRNADRSREALVTGLRQFAEEVSFKIRIDHERHSAVSMQLSSYVLVAAVIIGLLAFTDLTVARYALFYGHWYGQVLMLIVFGSLYAGYRLQRRKLNERY